MPVDSVHYVDRPIFALPVPHTWTPDAAVTLLGDAAHLMPPLGVGVNLAMLVASELALAVADSATIADPRVATRTRCCLAPSRMRQGCTMVPSS
ncbi:hypothetical protein ACIA5D_46115 [Actinoplanes sp. NPDC051513]|uniref:hypothetical protein n=1 Tax=Actinoplanes sp. NPDC051513 TaxID=3363908 RepID=UPI00378E95A4